jgi:hypothetical protein
VTKRRGSKEEVANGNKIKCRVFCIQRALNRPCIYCWRSEDQQKKIRPVENAHPACTMCARSRTLWLFMTMETHQILKVDK